MTFDLALESVPQTLEMKDSPDIGILVLRAQSLSQELPGIWHFRFSMDSDN